MREISIAGATDDERMESFSKSLLGMVFRWEQQVLESLVKEKGAGGAAGAFKKFDLLVPVEYLGKKPIEKAAEVRQATIGEVVEKPKAGVD